MPRFDKGESAIMEKEEFSIDDAEKIVKSALGNDALKRVDRMTDRDITEEEYKKYEEADKLSPDIRNIWWKTENERAQIRSNVDDAVQQKNSESGSLAESLIDKDDALSEIQEIILKEKEPDKIIKAYDGLIINYKSKLGDKDFLKESGDENAEKVSNSLKTTINELTNFKNQIKFITSNNNENFMTSQESSIINDPEAEIKETENEGGENNNPEAEKEPQESPEQAIEGLRNEIAGTSKSIQEELEGNNRKIAQKIEGLDGSDKEEIKTETAVANQELQDKVSDAEKDADNQRKEVALTPREAIKVEVDKDGKAVEAYIGSSGLETMIKDQMKGEIEKIYNESDFKNKSKGKRNKMVKPGNKIYDQAFLAAEGSMKKFIEEYTGQTYEEVLQKVGLGDKNAGVMGEYLNKIIKKMARGTIEKKEDNQENTNQPIDAPKNIEIKNEIINIGGPRISSDDYEKLNNIKNNKPKLETEIKNLEIRALQERADDELRSTEYALSIFEKGNSEELDALVNESIQRGKARKSKNNSKGTKEYLRIRFEDERKILNYVKAQLGLSKSAEEFHNIIRSYLKSVREQKRIELEQAAKNNKTAKPIENKYSAREGVLNSYLPSKKEVKIEPEPKQNQEVFGPMAPIEAQASVDGKESSKNPTELGNDIAEQRPKTYGKTFDKESTPGDAQEAAEKIKNGKKAKNKKTNNPSAEKQTIEEQLELPLEDKFEAEQLNIFNQPEIEQKTKKDTKPKTVLEAAMENDPFGYWKESQEPAKEGKKKEEPASAEATAGKEKTAEEILREKNIEVYGGAEKLNQIFEDYKRLNELEDRGAYFDEHPLFSEWDALRVKIANINLEVFGKDRTVDLYKIQNKDEMIREYFNTKLEEPLEDFQKDIQKASSNELAIRAATLIKYRNELKNCEWQGKDKYRDVPREKYVEMIKELEQKIDILNGILPKKEGVSPEAALKDLAINDFKKIEKEPEYKGGYPAVIEGEKLKTEMTAEQTARVESVLKEFNLTGEDAEKIEGFKDLSYGQRLLALQNLRQLTLRDVRMGAVETQKEEAAQTQGFWKKVWKGIKKRYDIAKHEKSIANDLNKEDYAATLAQLARGMKELKTDVVEKNGQLEFQYVSGLENMTPEQAARVQRFNEVASELSKLPMEWTADNSKKGFFRQMMDKAGLGQAWSPDDPTRSQHRRTGELNAEFQSLKQEVVRIIKRQKDSDLKKAGVEKFDARASGASAKI